MLVHHFTPTSTLRGDGTDGGIPIEQMGTLRLRGEKICPPLHSKSVTEQVKSWFLDCWRGKSPCITLGVTEAKRKERTLSRSPRF